MTTTTRRARVQSLKGGGYGVEKALSEICPRLLAGISLQTRRYLTATNTVKNGVEEPVSPTLFNRKYSITSNRKYQIGSTISEVSNGAKKSLNESALLILCEKVYNIKNTSHV